MRKPIRYALWSLTYAAPMFICLAMAFGLAFDWQTADPADTGHFTATLSAIALGVLAFVAPAAATPDAKSYPAMTAWLGLAAFAQLFVILFACAGSDHASAGSTAYLPGLFTVGDMTAIIILLIWSGELSVGMSPFTSMPLAGFLCGWIFRLGRTTGPDTFLIASAAGVAAVIAAGCVIALREEKEKPSGVVV